MGIVAFFFVQQIALINHDWVFVFDLTEMVVAVVRVSCDLDCPFSRVSSSDTDHMAGILWSTVQSSWTDVEQIVHFTLEKDCHQWDLSGGIEQSTSKVWRYRTYRYVSSYHLPNPQVTRIIYQSTNSD